MNTKNKINAPKEINDGFIGTIVHNRPIGLFPMFQDLEIKNKSIGEHHDSIVYWLETVLNQKHRYDYSEKRITQLEISFYRKFIALPLFFLYTSDNKLLFFKSDNMKETISKIGYIFVSKDLIREKFKIKKITQRVINEVKKILNKEIDLINNNFFERLESSEKIINTFKEK